MDSICDFIFTNPPLYNIHEFVFALIKFNGAWHLRVSVKSFTMERLLLSSVCASTKLGLACTPQGDIDIE